MLLLAIPVLTPLISIISHGELMEWQRLEVRLPFLVTALIIGFFNVNYDSLKSFKYGFVLGSLIVLSLIIADQYTVLQIGTHSLIDFYYTPLYLAVALVFIWYKDFNANHILKLLASAVILAGLIWLKQPLFIASGFIICLSAIIVKGSRIQSNLAIATCVLLGVIMLYNKGAGLREYSGYSNHTMLTTSEKMEHWQCVLEVMKNKELFGVGFLTKRSAMTACYHENGMDRSETMNFNAHNEFMDFFLTFGYIGLLLGVSYFVHGFFVAYDNKQVAFLLIIILIALFCLGENVFTRQKGTMLTSIIFLMIYSLKGSNSTDDKNINPVT